MAKQAVLQVRMDEDQKRQGEELYQRLGTSLAEAVRVFVAQSIEDNRMPFRPHAHMSDCSCKAFGALQLYANPALRDRERSAWVASLSRHEEQTRS